MKQKTAKPQERNVTGSDDREFNIGTPAVGDDTPSPVQPTDNISGLRDETSGTVDTPSEPMTECEPGGMPSESDIRGEPTAETEISDSREPETAPQPGENTGNGVNNPGISELIKAVSGLDADGIAALREAMGIDAEIEAARAAGELAGRNAGIEELLASPTPDDDGLPMHGGGSPDAGYARRSIFDLARESY